MELDPDGVISVDDDGVMRSFDADRNVIGYHQLDPEQLKSFAEKQLSVWDNSDRDVPDSVKTLAEGDFADGREVMDEDLLMHAAHPPEIKGSAEDSKVRQREVLDELNNVQARQACVGAPCDSLSVCQVIGCLACFFPIGPGGPGFCFGD